MHTLFMSLNRDAYAQAIGSAVRAELSRVGLSVASIAPVLSMSKTSLYARTQGREAFDYVELQLIADHIGISLFQLIESAEVTRKGVA